MSTRPLFSILHPTIRLPEGWCEVAHRWMATADDPSVVEYLLSIEPATGMSAITQMIMWSVLMKAGYGELIINTSERHCYVDAQNTAARHARGDWLITVADDWFPCPHWDTLLKELVPDPLHTEAVVKVRANHHPDLIIYPIMTRAYYERPGRGGCPNGELFYPEYLSMGSDDDLTEYATRDGVVINAPHMSFEHRHHSLGLAAEDEAYRHVSAPETWEVKERVISRRRAEGYIR